MSTIKNYMEISRYIDPTKTRGKKKTSSQAFIFVCLLLERQPPIFLFDAKTYQPAADASNERYNSRFQPIRSFLSKKFDTAVLLVKNKITSTLFVPHFKRPP